MNRPISLDVLAVWFTTTQRLLLDARNKRDRSYLRRAELRIKSPRFLALPQDAQDGLLELLGQANIATGPHTP
jgi:hypothetical protein